MGGDWYSESDYGEEFWDGGFGLELESDVLGMVGYWGVLGMFLLYYKYKYFVRILIVF